MTTNRKYAVAAAMLAILTINALEIDNCRLIPEAQKAFWNKENFKIPEHMTVSYPVAAKTEAELLAEFIRDRFPAVKVSLSLPGETALCRLEISETGVPGSDEGYKLIIDRQGIILRARSVRGLYYGVRTVENLLRNNRGTELPGVEIEDYPSLELRGVYMVARFLRSGDVPRFVRLIKMLGGLKYNALLLEFGENLPLGNSPFTARREPTLTLKALELIKRTAAENHIEIIPQIQAITHENWLRSHPDYLTRITARKGQASLKSWNTALCPELPLGRELTDYVIRETIRLFQPKRFHLNMDEFGVCGWSQCDYCKNGHTTEQLVREVRHYEELVYSLGAVPIVYHDSFIPGRRERGEEALDQMRKSTIIHIWDYSDAPQEKTFAYFREKGFSDLLSASFCHQPINTMLLPRLTLRNGGKGTVLTYWGYLPDMFLSPDKITSKAAAGTVLAANYAWKADAVSYPRIGYDPAWEFRRRLAGDSPVCRDGVRFEAVNIDSSLNTRLGRDSKFPMLDAATVTKVKNCLAQTPEKYRLAVTASGEYAAAIPSSAAPVVISIGTTVRGLSFLINSERPGDISRASGNREQIASPVAELKFIYEDGKIIRTILKYRREITDWNSETSGWGCRFVWRGNDSRGALYSFNAFDWENPRPDKLIKSVEVSMAQGSWARPFLLAASAWDPGKLPGTPLASIDRIPAGAVEEEEKLSYTECGNFASGTPGKMKFRYTGATVTPIRYVFADDPSAPVPGKVLEIIVPPAQKAGERLRVFIDSPLPAKKQLRALLFDYQVDDPTALVHTGAYLMHSSAPVYLVNYDFHKPRRTPEWHRVTLPVRMLNNDGSGALEASEAGILRLSFWIRNHREPVKIRVGAVGITPNDAGYTEPLFIQQIE